MHLTVLEEFPEMHGFPKWREVTTRLFFERKNAGKTQCKSS